MNRFIQNNSGLVNVAFFILLAITSWILQEGIRDYTEAVKKNTSAVSALLVEVRANTARMESVIGDVIQVQNSDEKQWKFIHEHEVRLAKLEEK